MSKNCQEQALLPAGFEDLLSPQAGAEYGAISALMDVFARFGYARVKPPLAEFEDSLLAGGPGASLSQDTFRVMDPVTHRMMGLRSDITAQIARIAASRLAGAKRPLRLTYANDVIRTRASQQRTLRQFTQVGCEMIGLDHTESDIEIAVVALCGLSALGVKGICLDFAVPRLTDGLCAEYALDQGQKEIVQEFLKTRDEAVLKNLENKKLQEILVTFLKASGPAERALVALAGMADLARLTQVVHGVQRAIAELDLKEISLSIDLLETKGFEYHNGVAFTVFSRGAHGEIGRGGRYDIAVGQSAAGFTFYMDTLRQVIQSHAQREYKHVSCETSWAEIKSLQDAGFAVLRGDNI